MNGGRHCVHLLFPSLTQASIAWHTAVYEYGDFYSDDVDDVDAREYVMTEWEWEQEEALAALAAGGPPLVQRGDVGTRDIDQHIHDCMDQRVHDEH